jgi:hypothetical protein
MLKKIVNEDSCDDRRRRHKMASVLDHTNKMEKCERSQLGDVGEDRTDHSCSGSTTSTVFCNYLNCRGEQVRDNDPLVLILHSCSARQRRQVLEQADRLNIRLIFIPPDLTDALQPTDRDVFGCWNAMARYLFVNIDMRDPDRKSSKGMRLT